MTGPRRQQEARYAHAGGPDSHQRQTDKEIEADVVAEMEGFVWTFPSFEYEEQVGKERQC